MKIFYKQVLIRKKTQIIFYRKARQKQHNMGANGNADTSLHFRSHFKVKEDLPCCVMEKATVKKNKIPH